MSRDICTLRLTANTLFCALSDSVDRIFYAFFLEFFDKILELFGKGKYKADAKNWAFTKAYRHEVQKKAISKKLCFCNNFARDMSHEGAQ
jgi:hypothetical protein